MRFKKENPYFKIGKTLLFIYLKRSNKYTCFSPETPLYAAKLQNFIETTKFWQENKAHLHKAVFGVLKKTEITPMSV